MMSDLFEPAWARFAMSGILILGFVLSDRFAARDRPARPHAATPAWVRPLTWVSIGAYYALIRPTGGPLLGGAGNLAGVGLCLVSVLLRSAPGGRYPELGARSLFYLALAIAVGVPWGLAVLSLPAIASSVVCCRHAERLEAAPANGVAPRFRMLHGIW